MDYPTQPHDQNKTKQKLTGLFFFLKAISERFIMKKKALNNPSFNLSTKSIASPYSNFAYDTNITRPKKLATKQCAMDILNKQDRSPKDNFVAKISRFYIASK